MINHSLTSNTPYRPLVPLASDYKLPNHISIGLNKYIVTILSFFIITDTNAQGNFSYSGLETVSFAVMDLSVHAGTSWTTDRLAIPGYFSAVNGASFSGISDTYNINGYVKKYGNEAFSFPVGTGNDLRLLSISAPSTTTDAYASAWILGDPGSGTDPTAPNAGAHPVTVVTFPLVSVSNIGQWDWQVGDAGNLGQGTTGTGANMTVSVSIPDMTLFSETTDLRLAGWNGSSWIDLSGTTTATGNTENSILSGMMVPGITAIAIASVKPLMSLPITLTDLRVGNNNCSAKLQWKTTGDADVSKFIVEQSTDGRSYKEIAVVNARRFSGENNYSVIVAQAEGVNYYRLRIMNDNATSSYSGIVACQVNCSIAEKIMVYPNPVNDQPVANLRIATSYRGNISVRLINDIGQLIAEVRSTLTAALTVIPINVLPLAHGIYYIQIIKNDGSRLGQVLELIKQ